MAVAKGERWIFLADLCPKSPYTKVIPAHLSIVKQNDAALRHPGKPSFKVMAYRFVGVQPIDVQKIDAGICKMLYRLIKGHTHEGGECPITSVMVLTQCLVDVLTVPAGMLISHPGIHGITTRIQARHLDCLTESQVRNPRICTQLYQQTGLGHRNQPYGKRCVSRPRRGGAHVTGLMQRRQKRLKSSIRNGHVRSFISSFRDTG